MDAQHQPSVSGYRMHPKLLPPIQTTVSKRVLMRPKPPLPEHVTGTTSAERVPLGNPRPQSSKTSLRTLFNKSKPVRRNTAKNDNSPSPILESKFFNTASPIHEAQAMPSSGSQTSQRTKSYSDPTVPSLARTSFLPSNPKLSKPIRDRKSRPHSSWQPPALFKAYPQAIKHATLPALNSSAETILRIQQQIKQGSQENNLEIDPMEKRDYKQAMKAADAIHKMEWTRKIYMLVTSGYLLQYSGDGNFDRLPEMILELDEHSVAFASDAIPGKHWVLQVSQTFDENGTTTVDNKKNFLSRLRLSDSPKMAKSFLLVLDNADDLAAWMVAMRREIEGLRGKEFVPETPTVEEVPQTLHRYQSMATMRNPARTQHSLANRSSRSVSSATLSPSTRTRLDEFTDLPANRCTMAPSIEASSLSTMTTTSDIDRRGDGSRLSYISLSSRTIASSHASSPPSSSASVQYVMPKSTFVGSPKSAKSDARSMSIDPPIRSVSVVQGPFALRRDSAFSKQNTSQSAINPQLGKPTFVPTPNFSVPVFSKRFSSAYNSESSQACSNASISNPAAPPPATDSSCCSSETSIDSSPEDLEPIERRLVRRPHVTKRNTLSSRMRNGNQSVDTLNSLNRHSSSQTKIAQTRTRRYSSSEHRVNIYSPISEVVPELPIINRHMVHSVQKTSPYHPSLAPSVTTAPWHQWPRDDRASSLHRPLSLQIKPTRTPYSKRPPSHSITQLSSTSRASTASTTPTMPDYSPPLPPQDLHKPTLSHQPSKSQTMFGPPPAPPPDCPLPDIPPIIDFKTTLDSSWNTSSPDTVRSSQIFLSHPGASGSQQRRSSETPRTYWSSAPSVNAGGLSDIQAAKKQVDGFSLIP
ncbi:hypothetical protein PRK78_002651 [Emydomyces testavorans]|uniref:PH domain-containing protein n=1 Tax=Emydomyces testavorans TaxID=2070801 RepID=A0AAF0DEQ9_9EURO|nr:hypothetical protein PRK78_002651 [Emydomyces testavorans]